MESRPDHDVHDRLAYLETHLFPELESTFGRSYAELLNIDDWLLRVEIALLRCHAQSRAKRSNQKLERLCIMSRMSTMRRLWAVQLPNEM